MLSCPAIGNDRAGMRGEHCVQSIQDHRSRNRSVRFLLEDRQLLLMSFVLLMRLVLGLFVLLIKSLFRAAAAATTR